ncbi:MAG: hypothetical protein ACR2ML_14140 [Solirubrobacteraceae bacterium]
MATTSALDAATGDPSLAEIASELRASLDLETEVARLGACLGPLLAQLGPGAELDLLRRAQGLWQRGLATAEDLNTARVEFELALARDDLPDAVRVLQMGLDRLARLHDTVQGLIAEVKTLQGEVMSLAHLPPHPRQVDVPSAGWDWADAFAGRRGLAFVAAMLERAQDERGRAFATGALAGYAGHVAGSAFLGAVVGGPRRLHRFRDRLARNALGAWLRQETGIPDPGTLAQQLRFEARDEPVLPPDVAAQLSAALAAAYPSRPAPELGLGYRRMLEHLDLLGAFRLPSPPAPPPIVAAPAGGPAAPIESQTFNQPADGDFTVAMGPDTNHDSPGMASQKKAQGDVCAYILLLIITLGIAYGLWCIGRLTLDKKCGIDDFVGASSPGEPDPRAPRATQQMLKKLREPPKANHILSDVYQLQLTVWQAFAAARSTLTVCGLLYPEESELAQQPHAQFLSAPAPRPWPLREAPGAEDSYATPPATLPEDPPTAFPFPNRAPSWLLHSDLVDNESTIGEVVIGALRSLAAGPDERLNLDLDADRGRLHPAWSNSTGTSISDQPLPVEILTYEAE